MEERKKIVASSHGKKTKPNTKGASSRGFVNLFQNHCLCPGEKTLSPGASSRSPDLSVAQRPGRGREAPVQVTVLAQGARGQGMPGGERAW